MNIIDSKINDYIVNNHYDELESFNKLQFFVDLSESLIDITGKLADKYFNEDNLTKCDLFTQIDYVKKFYQKNNVNLNIEQLIKDGTIHVNFVDNYDLYARNYYDGNNNFKVLDFNYSGHLIDSLCLVHELSHYRNQPDNGRTISNDFITEGLAFYDELLYGFFLISNGFEIDGNFVIKYFIDICNYIVGDNWCIFKIIHLFNTLGSVNKENYKLLYEDDYYEISLEIIQDFLNTEKNGYALYKKLYYIYGYYVVINLLDKYFNKNYSNINELYSVIDDLDYLNFFGNIDDFNKYEYSKNTKSLIKKIKNTYEFS